MKWYGDEVKRKMERAARIGINRVMADAVIHAKNNHEGWVYRSGAAEGSIRIAENARTAGKSTSGLWGSVGVIYFRWLEFGSSRMKGFGTLRKAAAAKYGNLSRYIREAFAG